MITEVIQMLTFSRQGLFCSCVLKCYKIIKLKTPKYLVDKIKFRIDIHLYQGTENNYLKDLSHIM